MWSLNVSEFYTIREKGGLVLEIYSLSGPSGTGKSTSALELAYRYHIEGIIDDGLLIVGGQKLAGTSAKFEKNALKAVRRAILSEDAHRDDIRNAIETSGIQSLLIIGTSQKMTNKIAARLALGDIHTYFDVTDIRTKKEIQYAKFVRQTQGKHVMPIPHLQVEQNFFKRLIKKGRDIFLNKKKIGETTIVQPDFHQETIEIAKSVYVKVLEHELEQYPQVAKFDITQLNTDAIPQIEVVLYVKAPVDYAVPEAVHRLQQQIAESYLLHFGVEPEYIHVVVKGIR